MRREMSIAERKKGFFAAANSGEGFASFYGEIFSPAKLERRYLIKGGAGSGKSSLMRRVADMAEKSGIGVEYYYCSSDYNSLDGVIIGGRVALIDSTPPHALECELAGAVDVIVDTGLFWDSDLLAKERARIAELTRKKKECYAGAYRYLEAALSLDRRRRECVRGYVDLPKLRRAAGRILRSLPSGVQYSKSVGLCSSIGMKGRVRLDSYERMAERVYVINDAFSTADLLLNMLIDEAKSQRCRIRVSYDPLDTSRPDALLFEDSATAFVIGDADSDSSQAHINMKRFIDISQCERGDVSRTRTELRAIAREKERMLELACDQLARAGEAHFTLESIYVGAMDFGRESEYCESLGREVIRQIGS